MIRQYGRLIEIDALLRGRLRQTSASLAESLEVSSRTIGNDLRFLKNHDAPLKYNRLIWESLLEASRAGHRVWMRYYAASDNKESERTIDPYLLHIYRATNPYVIGYCHLRNAIRWFRIDRIKQLKILDESFERPSDFNSKIYLDQIFQAEVGSVSHQVAIWFDSSTAPFLRERTWHMSQQITEQDDGSMTLHLKVTGLKEIKRWVMGYGKGAKVLEPQELVDLVKDEIKEMGMYYDI